MVVVTVVTDQKARESVADFARRASPQGLEFWPNDGGREWGPDVVGAFFPEPASILGRLVNLARPVAFVHQKDIRTYVVDPVGDRGYERLDSLMAWATALEDEYGPSHASVEVRTRIPHIPAAERKWRGNPYGVTRSQLDPGVEVKP